MPEEETQFDDITLKCVEPSCGKEFIWTAGEQEFMHELKDKGKLDEEQPDGSIKPGEVKPPKRCSACRAKRKAQRV